MRYDGKLVPGVFYGGPIGLLPTLKLTAKRKFAM